MNCSWLANRHKSKGDSTISTHAPLILIEPALGKNTASTIDGRCNQTHIAPNCDLSRAESQISSFGGAENRKSNLRRNLHILRVVKRVANQSAISNVRWHNTPVPLEADVYMPSALSCIGAFVLCFFDKLLRRTRFIVPCTIGSRVSDQ